MLLAIPGPGPGHSSYRNVQLPFPMCMPVCILYLATTARQQSPRLARAAVWADDVNGTSVRLVTSTPVPPWSLPTTSGHSVPVADKTSFELLEGRRP